MSGQSLECRSQPGIGDAVGSSLDIVRRAGRQVDGTCHRGRRGIGRLYLEEDAGEAGKRLQCLQITLQTLLLITQASRPVPIGDDQQQAALAP